MSQLNLRARLLLRTIGLLVLLVAATCAAMIAYQSSDHLNREMNHGKATILRLAHRAERLIHSDDRPALVRLAQKEKHDDQKKSGLDVGRSESRTGKGAG